MPIMATLTLLLGANLALARPAAAGPVYQVDEDGWCDRGEACLYFNSNLSGAVFDTTQSIPNYDIPYPRKFKVSMNSSSIATQNNQGAGGYVWNNAASALNRSGALCLYIFYNSNYDHHIDYQKIWPGKWANLDPILKNNNASQALAPC